MIWFYLISLIINIILFILIKNTIVYKESDIDGWTGKIKNNACPESLKFHLWLWIISIIFFFIPILNLISSSIELFAFIVYFAESYNWQFKNEWKFFKFLSKKY